MTDYNKHNIKEAVRTVYEQTDKSYLHTAEVRFNYLRPNYFGVTKEGEITISRSIKKDDLTYKLYTKYDDKPLMTIYGCWPVDFVSDVFIRALEHFYDDYSYYTFNMENENGWVRF